MECGVVGLLELPFEAVVSRFKCTVQSGFGHIVGWGIARLLLGRQCIKRFVGQGAGCFFAEQVGCGKVGRVNFSVLRVDLEEGIGGGLEEGAIMLLILAQFFLLVLDLLDFS